MTIKKLLYRPELGPLITTVLLDHIKYKVKYEKLSVEKAKMIVYQLYDICHKINTVMRCCFTGD